MWSKEEYNVFKKFYGIKSDKHYDIMRWAPTMLHLQCYTYNAYSAKKLLDFNSKVSRVMQPVVCRVSDGFVQEYLNNGYAPKSFAHTHTNPKKTHAWFNGVAPHA